MAKSHPSPSPPPVRPPTRSTVVVATAAAAAAGAGAFARKRRQGRRRADRRYRLRVDEPLAGELRRVACGQLEEAIDALEHPGSDADRAVHTARKAIKRTRTVARIVRDQLDDAAYDYTKTRLRVAGRELSAMRDTTVINDLLRSLEERDPGQLDQAELERVRQRVADSPCDDRGGDDPVGAALQALRDARAAVPAWPLSDDLSSAALARSLRRIYRRGRRSYRIARERPAVDRLHECRKRAKDLRYAAEVMRPLAPKHVKRIERQAKDLSDLLGDEHDLAVLVGLASDCPGLLALADQRRAELRARIFQLGDSLFSRSPRKLARRVRRGAGKRTSWEPAAA